MCWECEVEVTAPMEKDKIGNVPDAEELVNGKSLNVVVEGKTSWVLLLPRESALEGGLPRVEGGVEGGEGGIGSREKGRKGLRDVDRGL